VAGWWLVGRRSTQSAVDTADDQQSTPHANDSQRG